MLRSMIPLRECRVPMRPRYRDLKPLRQQELRVHPHFTICRLNQKSAVEYPEFCKEIGSDRFSANLIIPAGRGDDAELTIRYRDIGKIVEDIRKKGFRGRC